jgi:hypothetical protein
MNKFIEWLERYIRWNERYSTQERYLAASFERFFLPEDEITIKLIADNARTIAISSTLLYFYANFIAVSARIPESVCTSLSLLCTDFKGSTFNPNHPLYVTIALLPIVLKIYAYFMLAVGVIQAWILYVKVQRIGIEKGSLVKTDKELNRYSGYIFRKTIQTLVLMYGILATYTGIATVFFSFVSKHAP